MYSKRGILGRIQEKAKITFTGCWEITAGNNSNGYPRFMFNGDAYQAYRFVWEICHGEIPEGLNVLHKCHNKICVNPFHLNLGTAQDNASDITIDQLEQKEKNLEVCSTNKNPIMLKELEMETIQKVLEENKYSRTKTAAILGTSTTTLWRKIKKYKLL